jgi:hypothetical protein
MAAMDAEYDLLLEKINIKSKSKIRKFYIFWRRRRRLSSCNM